MDIMIANQMTDSWQFFGHVILDPGSQDILKPKNKLNILPMALSHEPALCPKGGVGRNNCIRSKFIHSLNQQPAKLPFLNIALEQSITVKRPGQGNGLDVKAGRIRFLLLQSTSRLLDRGAICMQDFMPPLCKLSAQLHLEGMTGMVVDEDTHY